MGFPRGLGTMWFARAAVGALRTRADVFWETDGVGRARGPLAGSPDRGICFAEVDVPIFQVSDW